VRLVLPAVVAAVFLASCATKGTTEEEKRIRMFLAPGSMGLSLVMPSGGFRGLGHVTYSRMLRSAARNGDNEEVRRTITLGGDVNDKDGDGWSPLALAVDARHVHTVALLVESKQFEHGNKGARNDLQAIVKDEALAVAVQKQYPEIVELLLKNGASPNAANDKRQTVLMRAALVGNADILRMLLAAGADRDARDAANRSATDWAKESACTPCIDILR